MRQSFFFFSNKSKSLFLLSRRRSSYKPTNTSFDRPSLPFFPFLLPHFGRRLSAMDGGVTTSQLPLDVYQNTLLRRRNSISQSVVVVTTCLDDLHQQTSSDATSGTLSSASSASSSSSTSTSSASSGEFDLISVKPVSYVSLRDLLPSPAAFNSPKPKSHAQSQFHPGHEISIRNRLVKQAAWAYLQPRSTAPDSSSRNFLHRLRDQFTTENPIAAFFRFFNRHVFGSLNRFFDWLLRSICIRSSR